MPINILIGGDSFRKLRELGCYYVDKTSFIEELLATVPAEVTLFTRPRRFGKSLMMSMLHDFFDVKQDSKSIFDGLTISRNTALCDAWMNKYPVISLSLKNVEGQDFAHALAKMGQIISVLCEDNAYLCRSKKISDKAKADLHQLCMEQADTNLLENSLLTLCRALHAHHGKPPILLIDEYDVPIACAERNGYYQEMVGFIRNMLGMALKTNPSLQFAILTGCLRIAKESIFTGLNNFKCYGLSETKFADKFGFTEFEVKTLLENAGIPETMPIIKEWYDGYHFGKNIEIYCPWDVLQYVQDLQDDPDAQPKPYWINSSGNSIVKYMLEHATQATKDKYEQLVAGGTVEEELVEELTYDTVYTNENNLWSMLYLTGYLTKASEQPDNGTTALVLPNKEVRTIFIRNADAWFKNCLTRKDLSPFVQALWVQDIPELQQILTGMLYDSISYYDASETFYHGFMSGLLTGAGFSFVSNRESGLGRSDLMILDGRNRRGIIIELKYAEEYADLDTRAEEALNQIDARNYAAGVPPNITTVIKYGIAFWKKECVVKCR